jgi:hypothetical protein
MAPAVKDAISTQFPFTTVYEERGGHLKFRVAMGEDGSSSSSTSTPTSGALLSGLFSFLERSKAELGILEYSVCQTTLEQLFLSISRHAEENAR